MKPTRDDRPTRSCPHPRCPACPFLGLPYAEQLERKRALVERAFAARFVPAAQPFPDVAPVRPSPEVFGYRATAKLALSRAQGEVRLGVYERGSHAVVDVPRCPVHHPLVAVGVRALRGLLGKALELVSPRVGAQGWLRYAAFQASVEERTLSVALVTGSDDGAGLLKSLAARLAGEVPEVSGVTRNVNASQGNEIFGKRWEVLWGEGAIAERMGDMRFRASPGAFLQANRLQAGWVYGSAAGWLAPAPSDVVLDLYAGVGGLALHLAPRVQRVAAVEGSATATEDGRWSARRAGIENAEFHAGRVEEVVPRLLAQGLSPSLVTLNPPRKGVAPLVVELLRSTPARALLYVSCNPETLARDAALLCRDGRFRLISLVPVDFFPQTEHVETVALFS